MSKQVTVNINLKETMRKIYEKHGQSDLFDWVNHYNKNPVGNPIPYEHCTACNCNSPAIDHECAVCGQTTKPVVVEFFVAVLKPVKDVIKHVYPKHHKEITLNDRLGNGCCEQCGGGKWWLLPKEAVSVKDSGKQWIECLECGFNTHL